MKLGAKLKQLREARNWTQHDLARKSSLSRSHVSHIENNKITNPGASAITRLARALEIDENILYEAAGVKPTKQEGDPFEDAIHDPILKNWINVANINSLPIDLQRAIAAIIQDFIERHSPAGIEKVEPVSTGKEKVAAPPKVLPETSM